MIVAGQICLLIAFVASGYAAFAGLATISPCRPAIGRSGELATVVAVAAITIVLGVLSWALLVKDFRLSYVAEYSSDRLPWHYSLSALWVGQAGSLLVWAWFYGVLALAYCFFDRTRSNCLRRPAMGVLMACLCFLVAVMIFAADPLRASVGGRSAQQGLSPLLQHPAMLIHPPIIFVGYAAWGIPFALAIAALLRGQLDVAWVRQARSWSLFAWTTLGVGIVWGGVWAYEELDWGGYWAWDPVENGSLIPWLTGTALVHALMTWQHRGLWKKTTLWLAITTFALCNFATFLTRSGIFSSLHAFSRSPIGWMFLLLMSVLCVGGAILIVWRRKDLRPERLISSISSREAVVSIAGLALLLLAAVTFLGTISLPLSKIVLGRSVVVGLAFYNNVLIPTGLVLLAATAAAPLVRWGKSPTLGQRRALLASAGMGVMAGVLVPALGVRNPLALAVAALATAALAALAATPFIDARRGDSGRFTLAALKTVWNRRRQYASYLVHVGFVSIAVGVTGSSLGTRHHEVVMAEGETVTWAGHSVRLVRLLDRELADKLVAEAELEITPHGGAAFSLFPAQHLHRLQNQWTTEVAIHSTWWGDFYTVARVGEGPGRAALTFVYNPLIRWIWCGGWIFGLGTVLRFWPARRRPSMPRAPPRPKFLARTTRRQNGYLSQESPAKM